MSNNEQSRHVTDYLLRQGLGRTAQKTSELLRIIDLEQLNNAIDATEKLQALTKIRRNLSDTLSSYSNEQLLQLITEAGDIYPPRDMLPFFIFILAHRNVDHATVITMIECVTEKLSDPVRRDPLPQALYVFSLQINTYVDGSAESKAVQTAWLNLWKLMTKPRDPNTSTFDKTCIQYFNKGFYQLEFDAIRDALEGNHYQLLKDVFINYATSIFDIPLADDEMIKKARSFWNDLWETLSTLDGFENSDTIMQKYHQFFPPGMEDTQQAFKNYLEGKCSKADRKQIAIFHMRTVLFSPQHIKAEIEAAMAEENKHIRERSIKARFLGKP